MEHPDTLVKKVVVSSKTTQLVEAILIRRELGQGLPSHGNEMPNRLQPSTSTMLAIDDRNELPIGTYNLPPYILESNQVILKKTVNSSRELDCCAVQLGSPIVCEEEQTLPFENCPYTIIGGISGKLIL